jgi:DNA-directed RNA polymerase specialized sigma24 family protein
MKQELNISNQQLGEWIDEWQESLFRYAFFRVGDRADAEDIVQDAFLKIASSTTTVYNPKA